MPQTTYTCDYCFQQFTVESKWSDVFGGASLTCPHCDWFYGTASKPGSKSKVNAPSDPTNQPAALAQKHIPCERVLAAAVVEWNPRQTGGSTAGGDMGKALLSGALGMSAPWLVAFGDSAKHTISDVGILAVGEKHVFLLRAGDEVTGLENATAEQRRAIRQSGFDSVCKFLTSQNPAILICEPIDASFKGFLLNIPGKCEPYEPASSPNTPATHKLNLSTLPSDLIVVGPATTLELAEAVHSILPFPSASRLVKEIVTSKLSSRLDALRKVLSTDPTATQFFKVLYTTPWAKQRIAFEQFKNLTDPELRAALAASAQKEQQRRKRLALGWLGISVLTSIVVGIFFMTLPKGPRQNQNDPLDFVFVVILAIFVATCAFSTPFWLGLAISEFRRSRRYMQGAHYLY